MSIFRYLSILSACLYYLSSYGQENELITQKKDSLSLLIKQQSDLKNQIATMQSDITKLTTPDRYWEYSSFTTATANITQYNNWVSGGENAVNLLFTHDFSINYINTPSRISWNNKFDGLLGYQSNKGSLQKTNDVLNIISNFSRQVSNHWFISAEISLRTQFLNTYNEDDNPRELLSSIFAPAYTSFGLGATWRPSPWFSANISPLTGQFIFVLDNDIDPTNFGVAMGKNIKSELGWYANLQSEIPISKSVKFDVRCILFDNYTNKENESGDIDVDARFKLETKLSKYFYASLFLNLKYDADQKITVTKATSTAPATYKDAGLQTFNNIGIGFSYSLDKLF